VNGAPWTSTSRYIPEKLYRCAASALSRRIFNCGCRFGQLHRPVNDGRCVKLADLLDNSDLSRIATPSKRDFQRIEKYRRAIELISRPSRLKVGLQRSRIHCDR
jgi:hypothetical protein